MKHFYFKSIFLSLLMMVTGMNVASAAPGDEIKSPSAVESGKSYYIKGVYTYSKVEYTCYYATTTDALGKVTSSATTEISEALPVTFTKVEGGWTLKTPNGYYVRPHTSNGQTYLVEDAVVLQLASGKTKEGEGKGIKIGPYTSGGNDWYIQCASNTNKIGGYKDTGFDITLIECGDEVSSGATFAKTNPSIDFPATSTYTQEATTAEGYTGTVSYEITVNTAGATIDGSTVTVTKAGSVTVKATAESVEGFLSSTATYTLTVNDTREDNGLEFAESSQEVTVGEVLNAPTLTNPNNLAVTYSSSDENIATVDADGNVTGVAEGTTEITATFEGNDQYKAGSASYNVTVTVGEIADQLYTLVTSVSSLAAGNKVIIVNKDAGKAMSTTQNSNNRGATDVTIEDNKAKVPSTKNIQVFTLEGDANGWYFNTGSGYIYAASKSSNHLKTQTTKNDNAKAVITITDDKTSVIFQREGSNVLQYNPNNGNPIFSCYASASQQPVEIYKQEDEKPKPSISFAETVVEITYGDNYNKQAATTEGVSGNLIYTSSNETVVKFHGNNVIDVLGPGTVTITATAPATETTEESSATYTLKIYEPAGAVEGAALSFDEHFDDCEADVPNENKWWGSNDFTALPDGYRWTVSDPANATGNGCLKVGASGGGTATSPSFTLNGTTVLSFDIAPWLSSSDYGIENGVITVTLTNATFVGGGNSVSFNTKEGLTAWQFTKKQYEITGTGEGVTIQFGGTARFFLDNVVVGGGAHEINLTFSSAGYLTWVATADIDFSQTDGVTAYQITEATSKKITMEEVNKVPKGAAVMLKGSGTKTLKRTTEEVADLSDNKMQACNDGSVTGNGVNGVTNTDVYVLGNGKNGLGFYMLKGTLQAGKGYLQVSESAGSAKQNFIAFEETTGVKAIEVNGNADNAIYNLQGIRVAHPQKGIYVKNGKKFVVK